MTTTLSLPVGSEKIDWDALHFADGAVHVMNTGIRKGWYSGYSFAVMQGDRPLYSNQCGTLAWSDSYPVLGNKLVNKSTLWDMASLVKSVPLALLVMHICTCNSYLRLDSPVTAYIPSLNVSSSDVVTIRDLLAFGATFDLNHLTAGPNGYAGFTAEQLRQEILNANVRRSAFKYSNYAPFILAEVLHRVTGATLDTLTKDVFLQPLGLSRSTFSPSAADGNIAVFSGDDDVPNIGQPHDGLVRALSSNITGVSGLFSTPTEICQLLHTVCRGRQIGGRTIIKPEILATIGDNHIDSEGTKSGLGFGLVSELMSGFTPSFTLEGKPEIVNGGIFRSGYTGGFAAHLPAIGLTVVFATNATHARPTVKGRSHLSLLKHVFLNQFLGGTSDYQRLVMYQ